VLSFVVELQQELFGREEGNSAELVKVLLVVCHYHITASGQGALVLEHVLEVLNLSQQTCVQLIGITGKYDYRLTHHAHQLITFCDGMMPQNITHVGITEIRGIEFNQALFAKLENVLSIVCTITVETTVK
jgi:hypothetical protein